jgi:RimJ/RimL family protein N-acetyltransferase
VTTRYRVPQYLFSLRNVNDDDHQFLINLHNDPMVLKNMTHSEPVTMESHLSWWKKINQDTRQLRLIFEVNGERAGLAKFYNVDTGNHNCVLGGDISSNFRGMGYAKVMWTLMLQRSFDEFNMYRVSLTTAEYNYVARRVYTKLGFQEEGRLIKSLWRNGSYHDQILMYMLKPTWESMEEQT